MNDIEHLSKISKNLKILYVEDDPTVRSKMTSLLKNFFDHIDVAVDGSDGIDKYEQFFHKHRVYYDIVITDICMPHVDGVQLSKYILELNPTQQIMVISAHDDSKYLIEFINLGIKKFLMKPFTTASVIDALKSITANFDEIYESEVINLDEHYSWNMKDKTLLFDGNLVKLSFNELVILDIMLSNPNKIYSSYDLYDAIKIDNLDIDFSVDSIKSVIKRLRKKLPEDLISNVYGQGYKLNKEVFLSEKNNQK